MKSRQSWTKSLIDLCSRCGSVIWDCVQQQSMSKSNRPYVTCIGWWPLYLYYVPWPHFNTLRPRQDGRHFAADIFTCIFLYDNCCILIKSSLKYVRKGPIDNNQALVRIMAWRRSGDKPLSEPMMISLRHIYASLGLNELISIPPFSL